MARQLKIYDSNEVTLVACGASIDQIGGYAGDEFVSFEMEEDAFVHEVGVDGDVTRSKTNNPVMIVTVKLMQSSTANDVLSAIHQLDISAGNGAGVGPFLLKDRQGATILAGAKSWVAKPPAGSFGKSATAREWKIAVVLDAQFHGGN